MAYEEKGAWVGLIVGVIAFAVYLAVVLGRAAGGPLEQTPYIDAMLWSIGAAIVVVIIVTIVVSILTSRDGTRTDLRDKQISARAEFTSRGFLILGALAALVLAMVESEYFWIANVLYLGFFLSSLLEAVTKIALYRTGMPAW
jgi:heme/copper-type cytochrome/quinol oxidase subunit 2